MTNKQLILKAINRFDSAVFEFGKAQSDCVPLASLNNECTEAKYDLMMLIEQGKQEEREGCLARYIEHKSTLGSKYNGAMAAIMGEGE